VDNKTVEVAREFRWLRGPTRLHVQTQHAGIYGQWIDIWTPRKDMDQDRSRTTPGELALILEDDISVSPYVYRWIKAVHRNYGRRKDFAGSTLTSDELSSHAGPRPLARLHAPKNHTAFMYKYCGTWSLTPVAR